MLNFVIYIIPQRGTAQINYLYRLNINYTSHHWIFILQVLTGQQKIKPTDAKVNKS